MNAIKNWPQAMQQELWCDRIERRLKDIYYFASKALGEKKESEQAAVAVAVRTYKEMYTVEGEKEFELLADRKAYEVCSEICDREARRQPGRMEALMQFRQRLDCEFIPRQYFCDKNRRDYIVGLVEAMPMGKKACVLLYYYRKLPCKQIAALTGLGEAQVIRQLRSAQGHVVRELKKRYDDYGQLMLPYQSEPLGEPVLTQILHRDAGIAAGQDTLDAVAAYALEKCGIKPGGGTKRESIPLRTEAELA